MAYTVNTLAKLSGVSVRTLHYYDDIGLLKPAYLGDNNYRYYEEEQLLMLQQVLFYRELGFPLTDIQKIMSNDGFDKIEALLSHKLVLKQGLDRTQELIKTIDKTIAHLRGKTKMRDEEIYFGFNSEKQKNYEEELIASGKVIKAQIDESRERVKHWKKSDWDKYKNDHENINNAFAGAIERNLDPKSDEVQRLVRKHYDMIKAFWIPNKEQYIGLGIMYTEHPDFRKFYERFHPKFPEYLSKAMKIFAERELS
ncbi:MAG: transcriptional regulator [Gammaproteobacteria bacterium RIFCSPLOWO2_02_FULL_42_14]|nr:MAG: transcriptional regulator [Gammaproteobacteria bacterium RIFCSPHIGHO2_02_FULL_42_43]OGT53612.1 MAG: transcriptional regulator [Gammaproteobacteria bacterium RIFCSPHIGHO2_12_FULL_41_25]OGT61663.1 MAG: transcriptional regulator [Gammaproteobacteria bacterium RIFCSPLOWO2_02_FULL_42_14]OGT85422.1 MAG: transcriptional regulator [Gammaproteobacteria bacterium RIFCSPLOWO2_12_FULL_42_18]